MRALNVSEPWGIDALQVVETPDPDPGPGEVVVRVRTASLNYRDLKMISGSYGQPQGVVTPLSDGCGIVEAVGAGVTRVSVGDRVVSNFFPNWIAGSPTPEKIGVALGGPAPGMARELALLGEQGVSKVPDFLTDQQAATLPCAALTAWRAMFVDADLQPGDTVVLLGTGGVSMFGLQFAKAAGCRTVVTSSSDEKLERAKALGADHLVNYRTTPEWSQAVRDATGGRGADLVLEVGGPGTIDQSLKAVRIGGHIAVIGGVASGGGGIVPGSLIGNSARVQGVYVGSREMFEAMCRAIELHRIEPVVDKIFPWTEAQQAFAAMRDGQHFGKIVLEF